MICSIGCVFADLAAAQTEPTHQALLVEKEGVDIILAGDVGQRACQTFINDGDTRTDSELPAIGVPQIVQGLLVHEEQGIAEFLYPGLEAIRALDVPVIVNRLAIYAKRPDTVGPADHQPGLRDIRKDHDGLGRFGLRRRQLGVHDGDHDALCHRIIDERLEGVVAGMTHDGDAVRPGGDGFLELWRVSPAVSGFLSKRWFTRGAYVFSDKTLDERADRDAQTHAGEADLYFFRRGLRSYFNVGYQFKNEDAEAARFDYRSHNVKLRYIHRLEVFSRLAKIELSWRFEDRDYLSETPSIGEDRDDTRNRWKVDLEYPVTDRATVQLYGGYAEYDSNFPAADYYQTVFGTRFLYSW